MKKLSIMGIRVDNRKNNAPKMQEIFTKHGESIISRLGMHDPGEVNTGLITLNLLSMQEQVSEIANELSKIDGVKVKHITMD